MSALIASALSIEGPIGLLEAMFGVITLALVRAESGRWPGQFLRWTPYVSGGTNYNGNPYISVGVRKQSRKVVLVSLDPTAEDFDQALADAESVSRERCIQLNATDVTLGRRLP